MVRSLTFFACIVVLLSSCSFSKENSSGIRYDVDCTLRYCDASVSEMQLSMLCDSIESIPLDTTGGFLLGRIEYVCFVHNHFFVLDDSDKLYVFDRSGHGSFILDRKGQGPHEYVDIHGFDVANDSSLCLLTYPPKLMYFDWNGTFVKEVRLANRGFELSLLSDDFAVLYRDNVGSTPDKASFMLDVLHLPDETVYSHVAGYRFMAHRNLPAFQQRRALVDVAGGGCLFVPPLSNLVYSIDKTGVHVKYMLDFGSDNPPADLTEQLPSSSLPSDFIADRFPVYGFNSCWENSRYFYIQFYEHRQSRSLLYDKTVRKSYVGNFLNDDLTDCTPSFFMATEEALIGYWTVDEIVSLGAFLEMRGKDKKPFFNTLLHQAESFGNPIMCLYHFK